MAKNNSVVIQLRRVSDFVTKMQEVNTVIHIEDIFGTEVTIDNINVLKGKDGEYLFIVLKKAGETTTCGFSCGGVAIVRKLKEVMEKRGFPCLAVFKTATAGNGQTYFDVE